MASTSDNRFIHSKSARLVALVLAVLLALLFLFLWGGAAKELVAGESVAIEETAKTNPGLAECIKIRVGHVDKLKSEGTIDDHQYASFKTRAEALCQAQNPS